MHKVCGWIISGLQRLTVMARSASEGTNGQPVKDTDMARSRPSARDALIKLRAEREELTNREAALREEAAADLGRVLLECDAETLDPAQLRQLLRASMTLGIDAAIARLSAG
jgi:hypothetical protein